jgi:hypothetical protein
VCVAFYSLINKNTMGLYKVMTMKDRIQKVKETGKEASMTH